MGQTARRINRLRHDEMFQVGTLDVKLFDTTNSEGERQVAVLLEESKIAKTGELLEQDMMCDLDRLEAVVAHGRELKANLDRGIGRSLKMIDPDAPESVLHLRTWTARFYEREGADGNAQVIVRLDQKLKDEEGRVETQKFLCDLDRLAKATSLGVYFEEERGFKREWYAVISITSITDEGYVKAKFVHWDKDPVNAQIFADKNRNLGYCLLAETFRRPLRDENLRTEIREELIPKLGPEIRFLKEEQKRVGDGLLQGIWYEKGVTPRPGDPVKILGGRDEASREPTEYRITPPGVQTPRGKDDQPIHVILKQREGESRYEVLETFLDERIAEKRFGELKTAASLRLEQLLEMESPIDLSQHILPRGPRRNP